jgi:Domain of unknown function (DUF4145)
MIMSKGKYVAPEFKKAAFTCPFCDVYSNFSWNVLYLLFPGNTTGAGVHFAYCSHCKKPTIWKDDHQGMIWPQDISAAPLPNSDMPPEIEKDYLEARSIASVSPRGAAALLRLSVQKLCKHLGESGDNVNSDIGNLVKKGLPIQIQKALDIVRVTGNNAVHPGEMQLQEDPGTVTLLFELVNLIAENQISQPKAINALYSRLPTGAVEAIKKRDGTAANN